MIYFISDTHFFHENIIKFCNRPFKDAEEMNYILIENWQRTVKPEDTVYFLGDFTWDIDKGIKIWNRLNGRKVFIRGNHDDKFINALFAECGGAINLKITDIFELHHNKTIITMCHYPMVCWNRSHFNAPLLYGHVHSGKIPLSGKVLDVSVENINYTPISLDEVIAKIEKLPDNWNYIKGK
jgi:calcineurin-like phosphoesterase family protein